MILSALVLILLTAVGAVLFARRARGGRNSAVLAVLDALPDGITLADARGNVVWLNATALAKTGWRRDQLLGRRVAEMAHPDDAEMVKDRLRAIAATPLETDRLECRLRLPDKEYVSLECTMRNLLGVAGIDAILFCIRDVSAQIRWRRELESAREKAEALAKEKGHFLAVLGHEIRTPLQALEAALRTQTEESPTAAEAAELRELSLKSAGSLLQILDDLLDLSRLNAKVAPVRNEPFDPMEVAREVAGIFGVQARSRGGSVQAVQVGVGIRLLGDSARIRQILSNLVGNAVRHAGGTEIEILFSHGEISRRRVLGLWEIRDRGPGVSPEEAEAMFRIWQKGASSTGSGLGMAIVQGLVEVMGGSIDVAQRPGGGLCVRVQLPMDVAIEPLAVPAAANKVSILGSPRILVAEDDRTNQIVIRRQLENLGCRCTIVDDGSKVLAEVKAHEFDLVLLDCQMPVMDGYAACREIRHREAECGLGRTPVLAVTAWAMQSDRDLCLESGMDAVLTKPLRQAELASTLVQWLDWVPKAPAPHVAIGFDSPI